MSGSSAGSEVHDRKVLKRRVCAQAFAAALVMVASISAMLSTGDAALLAFGGIWARTMLAYLKPKSGAGLQAAYGRFMVSLPTSSACVPGYGTLAASKLRIEILLNYKGRRAVVPPAMSTRWWLAALSCIQSHAHNTQSWVACAGWIRVGALYNSGAGLRPN